MVDSSKTLKTKKKLYFPSKHESELNKIESVYKI